MLSKEKKEHGKRLELAKKDFDILLIKLGFCHNCFKIYGVYTKTESDEKMCKNIDNY
jgi:hypothetical protein